MNLYYLLNYISILIPFLPLLLAIYLKIKRVLFVNKWKSALFQIFLILLSLLLIYSRFLEPNTVIQKETNIETGFKSKIVLISDLHVGAFSSTKMLGKVIEEINSIDRQIDSLLEEDSLILLESYEKIRLVSENFDVRKMAACTKDNQRVFYIICGWISENDAKQFMKEIDGDEDIFCVYEDDHNNIDSIPPTKLNNPKIFRPFEMFIRMYGLPAYNEFDPTIFVAITYTFLFGFMFGDVGQGIVLTLFGYILYKIKKMDIAAIISCAGVFSTFFGFMFGSVFGFENWFEPLWIRPITHMTALTGLGRLNTVFIVSIIFGTFLMITSMLIHIYNGVKAKDIENIFFDTNGIAGLIFYVSAISVILLFMTGHPTPGGLLLFIMFGLPLITIALKEPLTKFVRKKQTIFPKEKGMFLVQAFFELFEILLSYFSNTLSFVRIGAFAVSHMAMMEVVLILSGAEHGAPNLIVIILGNIVVCVMEGLIVGIQVLRLEYFEMFSRFYKGNGRAFKPYSKSYKKEKQLI